MNKKWDNIDPDFDNANTINGWKLKVLDVEMFMIERPNMSSFDTAEIQTAINSSLALLDAECNGLIQEVWFVTDTTSSLYRSGKEKNYIREAAIMQTQYFINLGNDYTDGSTSFNASGISASFQRPLDKKNIAPGVFVLLQKGRVYELQSYDLGRNMSVNKQPTNTSLANYVQFGVGDVRYITYNQMPYNRQEGSLLYVDKGEIKFFTVEQLDLTVPRAYLLWDKATKSFEDIHDVKDIAFFGNQLDNAITRQEAEELIAASPSGVSKEYVDDGLTLKQNKLTAGTGIDITDDVISATGGTATGDVTLDTAQTITGEKTFSKKLTLNKNLNFEIAGSNAAFIDWYKDGVRLANFGKGSSSKNEIQLEVVADLVFNAANIRFSGKELRKITTPTADDSAATKKYVDDNVLLKQNKLTAGTNITIVGDTISSSGGTTNGVTLDTAQTITGRKTFTDNITINGSGGKKYFFDTDTVGGLNIMAPESINFAAGGNIIGFYKDGFIRCFNNRIIEVGTPTANTDAANKKYVDDGLALKADKTAIDTINVELGVNSTNISQNSADILLKANKDEVVDLSSTQGVRGSKTFMNACYVNTTPTNGKGIANKEYVDTKQAKLTAGAGIDITGDTISSTGGTTNGVTLDTDQTITGKKTFSGDITIVNEITRKNFYFSTDATDYLTISSPKAIILSANGNGFGVYDNFLRCFNKKLTEVGTPTANTDAANKEYVDKADTLFKRATTSIASTTTAGDSTQTITSIFDAATWDLIKGSNQYYLLAYTSSRASRTGFPMVIRMEYAMTSNDYNIHTGAGDFTFFNYTDFATTYAIKIMIALSRANGSFRFAVSFNGTLNANFNINRIEIWKKGTV